MATPFTNAQGESYVTEIQWNGYDSGLTPEVVEVLKRAQTMVDFPIVVRSGARDPARNARVGGAKASEHIGGNAVDISLNGLSNQQRTQLTRALVQSGAKRLGAYSGNTGLHFDMKDQGPAKGYPVWPMFDRTIKNMDKAPAWFKAGLDGAPIPPGNIPGPAPVPAGMSDRIRTARLGADDAGIGTAFSQLERFGQPGAAPVTMSGALAYSSGRLQDVPLPRARPIGPVADVAMPRARPTPPAAVPRPSFGIVDATRSPTLFSEGVGIPNEHIPGSDATYSGANRMSVGGLGALLDPRSFSPSTPNPTPLPQPSGPIGRGRPTSARDTLPAYRRDPRELAEVAANPGRAAATAIWDMVAPALGLPTTSETARQAELNKARRAIEVAVSNRTPLPQPSGPTGRGRPTSTSSATSTPPPRYSGTTKTTGGIAGTVQLPRDVRPNVPTIGLPPTSTMESVGFSQGTVPKYLTKTIQVANPDYKQVNPGNPTLAAMGFSPGTMPTVPKTISKQVTYLNPAWSPTPATMSPSLAVSRMAPAPIPATQSAGLLALRSAPKSTSSSSKSSATERKSASPYSSSDPRSKMVSKGTGQTGLHLGIGGW